MQKTVTVALACAGAFIVCVELAANGRAFRRIAGHDYDNAYFLHLRHEE